MDQAWSRAAPEPGSSPLRSWGAGAIALGREWSKSPPIPVGDAAARAGEVVIDEAVIFGHDQANPVSRPRCWEQCRLRSSVMCLSIP